MELENPHDQSTHKLENVGTFNSLEHVRSENELFGFVVFEELKRLGVKTVFISPGSRSTPLVLGAAAHNDLEKVVHHDERGLAFAALGVAKATQTPVALVTTSGTAVSNLLPAITEAFYSKTPLIVLSADRPFDLRETGANQSIDQVKLFSSVTVDQFDIPAPSSQTHYNSIFTTLAYAVTAADKGPIHINMMFSEPLSPPENTKYNRDLRFLNNWFKSKKPHVLTYKPRVTSVSSTGPMWKSDQKVLIVAGAELTLRDQVALLELSKLFHIPILVDVLSGLKFFSEHENVILNTELVVEAIQTHVDVLLHFGGALQSKKLNTYCENLTAQKIWVYPDQKRREHLHQNKVIIHAEPHALIEDLLQKSPLPNAKLINEYKKLDQLAHNFIKTNLVENLTEPAIANSLVQLVPPDGILYSGSSRPIRDFERYGASSKQRFQFYSNRGTSGIDGNIATFFGLAKFHKLPSLALIGDLAFLHDVSSLPLLKQLDRPAILVVINNDGGGIFSFLPVSEQKMHFERYFGTPHGHSVTQIASGFNLPCHRVSNLTELKTEINKRLHVNQISILEIQTQRQDNLVLHKHLQTLWQQLFIKVRT